MKTLLVSFYGGPGVGKSRTAAKLFAKFKDEHLDLKTELVREYVKGAVYSENTAALMDQFYLTGKFAHHIHRLEGKVDLIIADAGMLNSVVYVNQYTDPIEKRRAFISSTAAIELSDTYNNFGIHLVRQSEYQAYGRTQTLEEARVLDEYFKVVVDNYRERFNIETIDCTNVQKMYERIVEELEILKDVD